MKDLIKKIVTLKNIFGLLTIVFYFIYVGVNMYIGHGNKITNIILLILTSAYFLAYIYSVFIESNKKMKKSAKKLFVGGKKLLGFSNACMIISSVFIHNDNSIWTIFTAIVTIIWFFMYLFIEVTFMIISYKLKKYKRELGYKFSKKDN